VRKQTLIGDSSQSVQSDSRAWPMSCRLRARGDKPRIENVPVADYTSNDRDSNARCGTSGIGHLPRVGQHDRRCDDWSKSSRRILGVFGEFAAFNEP
jgi:hypothetical protein